MRELTLEEINGLKITSVSNRSVVFNSKYHATKRVANDVLLNQVKQVYVQKINTPVGGSMEWLATPSRF